MEITLQLNIFNTYTVQKFSDLYACQPKKRDVKNKKKSCENTEKFSTRMRDSSYKVTTARVIATIVAVDATDSNNTWGVLVSFFKTLKKDFAKLLKLFFLSHKRTSKAIM